MQLGAIFQNIIKAHQSSASFPDTSIPFFAENFNNYGIYPNDLTEDYQSLYKIQSTIYKCVYTVAHNFATVPIEIYKKNSSGEKDVLTDKPEFNIFKEYNPWQTKFDFWESVIGFLEITGECFILKLYVGTKIVALVPLRPDKIIVVPSSKDMIDHYIYTVGGKRYNIPSNEILFLRYFNPSSDYRGLSPMNAAINDVKLDLKATSSNTKTFENQARPSGIISTEQQLGEHAWNRYKKEFENKYIGEMNKGKVLFLDSGMSWSQVGLSAKDVQYMEQRNWSKDMIRQVYGVPPIYLMDFSDSSVLANAGIQETLLWTETILPKQVKIASAVDKWLMPELISDLGVNFGFDNSNIKALQPDKEKLSERFKTGISFGAVTPNEMREQVFNLPRVDDDRYDTHYIAANLIPMDGSSQPQGESSATEKALDHINEFISEHDINEGIDSVIKHVTDAVRENRLNADDNIKLIKANAVFVQIRNKFEKKFINIVISLFNKQKNEIISKLDVYKSFKYSPTEVNISIEEWLAAFEEAGSPYISGSFEYAGIQFANELKNGTFIPTDPSAVRHIKARTHNYASLVNNTTFDRVNNILANAIEQGLSVAATQDLIRQYFTNNNAMRSLRIARTELQAAANYGRLVSMQQNGFSYHRWVTMGDTDVRDSHMEASGQIVKTGADFNVGSGYGGDKSYPSDINERCFTIATKKKKG